MSNEKEIRNHIINLIKTNLSSKDYVIREEFNGGPMKTRADLALFSKDSLSFFEIKSDKDNFLRLSSQIRDYSKYADNVFLIVDISHHKKLLKDKSKYPELKESNIFLYDNGTLCHYSNTNAKITGFNQYTFAKGYEYKNLLPLLWSHEIKSLISFVKGRSKVEARKVVSNIYTHAELYLVCKEIIFNRSVSMRGKNIKNIKTFKGGTIKEIQNKDLKQMLFDRYIQK